MLKIVWITMFLLLPANLSYARARIPFGNMEKITVVEELPEEYKVDSRHVDLARYHREYNVAWIPLWITEEPKLVLYESTFHRYADLSDEEFDALSEELALPEKEKLLKLGWFRRFGGKGVGAVLVLLMLGGIFMKDDDD